MAIKTMETETLKQMLNSLSRNSVTNNFTQSLEFALLKRAIQYELDKRP
ncbi:hypothetical protein [Aquibacillus kalidii]|nr:hypothetical protein [Aquibacillus kalidii]